jgi:hypothetical protein
MAYGVENHTTAKFIHTRPHMKTPTTVSFMWTWYTTSWSTQVSRTALTLSEDFTHTKQGDTINAVHKYPPIKCIHDFKPDPEGKPLLKWKCKELLYVSDTATESHYARSHKNKGKPSSCFIRPNTNSWVPAQFAGTIITDMTFLRDEGLIDITYPEPDENGVIRGGPHYRVEYDIVPTVEDRNLRYDAIWTPKENGQGSKRKRLQTAQISIASAFQPGTGSL